MASRKSPRDVQPGLGNFLAETEEADPSPRLARAARAQLVIGVDEVGRGPLAGPVVTCAVALRVNQALEGVTDSKALTPARRAALLEPIRSGAVAVALAEADVNEIDAVGIRNATLDAMKRAVLSAWRLAGGAPCVVLVDGVDTVPGISLPQHAVVRGDARVTAIGAASVVAKEHRDAFMVALGTQHPQYGFEHHKGYGSAEHLDALVAHGPCPQHRRSFDPVRTFVETGAWPPRGDA